MKQSSSETSVDFVTIGKRMRQRRIDFGLGTEKLAELAGVARYTIVRIEKGLPSTRATRQKIQVVLRMWSDQLYRPAPQSEYYSVHRAEETRWTVSLPKAEYQRRLVEDDPIHVDDPLERKRLGELGFQPFFTAIMNSSLPGGFMEQALMELHRPSWVDSHYGEEFVYGLRGEATIRVNDEPCELKPGDCMTFDAQLPHQYLPTRPIGKDEDPVLIFIVVTKKPVVKTKQA